MRRASTRSRRTYHVVLLGYFEAGGSKRLLNQSVGVEVYLPIILVVAIGTHGKHRPREIECEYLHVGSRGGHNIRDGCQRCPEQSHGGVHISAVCQLRRQVYPAVSVGGIVLNHVTEDLSVPHDVAHV